jgi:hypothetical protein
MDENMQKQADAIEEMKATIPNLPLAALMALGDKMAMLGMLIGMAVEVGGEGAKKELGPLKKALLETLALISYRVLDLGREAGELSLVDYGFMKARLDDAIEQQKADDEGEVA